MKNLPTLVKSIILVIVMAAAGILATGYMAMEAKEVAIQGSRIHSTDTQAALSVANAKGDVTRALSDLLGYEVALSASDKAGFIDGMNAALKDFNANMDRVAVLVPAHLAQVRGLQQQGNDLFNKTCAKSLQMAAAYGDVAGQSVLAQGCLQAFAPYTKAMNSARDQITDEANQKYGQLTLGTQRLMWESMIALILAIIVIAVFIYFTVQSTMVKPLKSLTAVAKRLSQGDFSAQIPDTNRRDEVGQMAKAVLIFKDSGIERLRVEREAKRAQEEIEAERARNEAAQAEMAQSQVLVVEALASGLERLASGDLAFRITQTFTVDYDKLRLDFNKAMETLQHTMQRISENAVGVYAGAGEITQSADDLSRRTEQQAASLEQTAAALDEITATVKKASEGANEARGLANEAKSDAERSGGVVNKTIVAMGEIEASSKKISNIIGVIDEIAFQTNLLALNAGVEAARAGDAGRGFAVVATEVRALAQRSADAAKEIKSLIVNSGTQVESGVKLVNETGQALGRIVDQVARLSVLVTGIANSSKEQATALEEVNSAVNQMDQVTQQNAAMVEKSTSASYALVSEAEDLNKLVGQFQVGLEGQRPAVKMPAKPAKQDGISSESGRGFQKPALKTTARHVKSDTPQVGQQKSDSLGIVTKPKTNIVSKLKSDVVSNPKMKFLNSTATDDGDWSEF